MENPMFDFMAERDDAVSQAYQNGLAEGARRVLQNPGFYLVKDERIYAVDLPYEFKYQKSVDIVTGKVHYPTNRMHLRGMADAELVKHLSCPWKECKNMDVECDKCLLDWLREEVQE